jgi:hypothetical protein
VENAAEYLAGKVNAFLAIMFEAIGLTVLAGPLKLDLFRFLQVVRQMLRLNADMVAQGIMSASIRI